MFFFSGVILLAFLISLYFEELYTIKVAVFKLKIYWSISFSGDSQGFGTGIKKKRKHFIVVGYVYKFEKKKNTCEFCSVLPLRVN